MKPILGFVILAGAALLAGCATSRYQHVTTTDGREYYCAAEAGGGKTTCYTKRQYFAMMQHGIAGPVDPGFHYDAVYAPQMPSTAELYGPQVLNAPPGTSR